VQAPAARRAGPEADDLRALAANKIFMLVAREDGKGPREEQRVPARHPADDFQRHPSGSDNALYGGLRVFGSSCHSPELGFPTGFFLIAFTLSGGSPKRLARIAKGRPHNKLQT
jgi:hypothetical protein